MPYWLALLAGSLVFGSCLVAAMVLPRHYATLTILLGIGGFVATLYILGTIAQVYSTPVAIGAAVLVVVAGISLGYTIAASTIPHLADLPRGTTSLPPARPVDSAIVLLESAEPDRYDPRAVAHRHNLLADSAEIELPLTAIPFIFLTEKTRYRAVGGSAPGHRAARSLAEKVEALWDEGKAPEVALASNQYPGDLRAVVAARIAAGADRVVVVALGATESAATDRALESLDAGEGRALASRVTVAPSIWHDSGLVSRLVERIVACVGDTPRAHIGVALVCPGAPEVWEHRYAGAAETENYFVQRVRMRLTEAGLKCDHLRVAWLEWQAPDVTETVRHLAVLGCQRIICVPATTVLPTLDTLLELERATTYARVPDSVSVVTLGAWADDDAIARAVRAAATSALEGAGRQDSGAL
ncbi:MAG: ferrochelatase [Coriobacteriia bacterium]|nr:ferrochelatase [Coriobacteriia bacterium]MBN2841389.1 ferrochelatase [Coriobacteriia bacterium]